LLFPQRDARLRVGTDVDVDGIRKGEHVNFPVRYDLGGQLKIRTPVAEGVITEGYVEHGRLGTLNFWEATTDDPEHSYMNLNKVTGPSYVDLGTIVEIYGISREGIRHIFVNDWGKAERQYPAEPLTEEQRATADMMAERLRPEFWDVLVPGTVAIIHPPFSTVVLDEFRPRNDVLGKPVRRRTENFDMIMDGNFPVGTRVLIGSPRNPEHPRVHRL
jgi:hypothetical protein